MNQVPEVLVSSLAPAAVYALIGAGFVIIYRGTRVVNFLQGYLAYVGALMFVTVSEHVTGSFLLTVAICIGIAAIIGLALYLVTIRPLTGQDVLVMVMVTLI